MRRITSGLARGWAKIVDHPRLRPLWFVAYSLTIYGGLVATINPPRSVVEEAGSTGVLLLGLFMTLGGVIAGLAVWTRWWQLERLGIGFASLGVGLYAVILFAIDLGTETGTRQLQISVVLLGSLLYFIRWAGIRGWDYEPPRRED